jgi:hypothetical protein
MILLPDLPGTEPLHEAVLFGFDNHAFPFLNHVQAHLIPGANPGFVLPPGPPGSHDEQVRYYGTVIRIGDLFHMWYNGGHGPTDSNTGFVRSHFAPCYATSADGVHWEKPALGLVEYNGSTQNNLVDFPASRVAAIAVLYEADDPNPQRRFKMAFEAPVDGKIRFCVAFSPDGLRWHAGKSNPVGPFLEMCGITKFRGLYYANGQPWLDVQRPVLSRQLVTFVSADFEYWSPAHAMGLERAPDMAGPSVEARIHSYEEVHLGAALWNRNNVLVGIYGQWHGHPSGDRRLLTMDLGLALTYDAIHFHEPIPGFQFIPAREQPGSPQGGNPALMQGQGMENVGDRTLYWYSLWTGPEGSGVRMVSWERDRLGMLKPFRPWWPNSRRFQSDMQAISCSIQVLEGGSVQVYVNASGLSEHSQLRIGLLDHRFKPLPGYHGSDSAVLNQDGFHIPVSWGAGNTLPASHSCVRLDIQFEGLRAEDCLLHAVYLETAG